MFRKAALSGRTSRVLITLLIVAVCAPRVYVIFQNNLAYCRPGTPALAKRWIEEHVPQGTRVLLIGFPGTPNERKICPLRDTDANIYRFADQLEKESPIAAKFMRLAATQQTGPAYDLTAIDRKEPWITLDEAKRAGIRYVLISVEDFTDHVTAVSSGRHAFYTKLKEDANVVLRQSFAPRWINYHDSIKRDRRLEIYEILYPRTTSLSVGATSKSSASSPRESTAQERLVIHFLIDA
jgi:hypothetical protein